MKVLVGIDGSPGSLEAVRLTGRLVSPQHDKVCFYYAPPVFQVVQRGGLDASITTRARQALATAVFDDACNALPAPLSETVERIVGTQDPRHGLILAGEVQEADLIVVGARGLGPLQRLLLGSVSSSIVHAARCPVLVVRAQAERLAREPLRVLLATAEDNVSRRAADLLPQFTWPAGTEGRVITVIESMFAGEIPKWLEEKARSADAEAMAQAWVREHDVERQAHRNELAALIQQLPAPFHGHEPIVAEGHTAEQILKAIAAESIDLVVLGARGLGAISRVLVGSTSAKVLSHAPCSVLIVRQPERP